MRFRQHEATARQSTLRLLLLFALVVAVLLVAVNAVLALIFMFSVPYAQGWPAYFFETNTALVLLFVLGGCWVETLQLRGGGGAHVARLAGGRVAQVSRGSELGVLERRLVHTLQEMAIASGHPGVPAAWVLPNDDAINAFAAGWGPDDAVVAVTRGALERLTRAELQGVVAHEFSHLVHGDARLNMRLVGLVWGLQMIWSLGRSLCETDDNGHYRAGLPIGLGLLAVGSLGWAAGRLLQAAVSRQREFLADASAVKYTRAVDGLGGALRKIADQQTHHAAQLRSSHAASLAHLLLASRSARRSWYGLWHTHPPLAERLLRLYGHEVLPLAADVLPFDAAEEPGGAVYLTPGTPGGPAPGNADTGGAAPEAHDHDATQRPSSFDAAERERVALARIDLWIGPGEWQAAMLALALEPEAAGATDRWAAWQAATADLSVAAPVRREIEALSASARRRVLALLLQRARAAALAQRRLARQALRQRRQAWQLSPAAQWQALASGLMLGPRWKLPARASLPSTLPQLSAAAHAATRLLATSLGATPAQCHAWRQAAAQGLAELGATAPRGPGLGLAPATPLRELQLALRVRRLAPMQRPLLLRAWLQAAEGCSLAAHTGTVDALHLACLALDLPIPPALSGS
jgi:Zn-dependent protease with chaperone function